MRPLALVLALVLATPAAAQQLIASYTAFIGPRDLVGEDGRRLHEPWQILRQDRANFHRHGIRQFADEGDPVFASVAARAQIEALLRQGRITPEARRAIQRGNLIVHVQVWDGGDRLHAIHVHHRRP
jgi:hypothetical protein